MNGLKAVPFKQFSFSAACIEATKPVPQGRNNPEPGTEMPGK